ncbi:MAG: hypothetical protein HY774_27030 [Acidobacteria bacterium]|nr:hypothetical protein [Acidobacteriota bacterium]
MTGVQDLSNQFNKQGCITMSLNHWNYFLSIEQDAIGLSRYIEFCKQNYKTYSIEIARILMASTQEIDVLMKQLCQQTGLSASNEGDYRRHIATQFPKLPNIEINLPRYELSFTPFEEWANNKTPVWWTANNKVKHQRHTHYEYASLENLLNSLCGLMVSNLYFYRDDLENEGIYPGAKLLVPKDLISGVSPTIFGLEPNYRLPK